MTHLLAMRMAFGLCVLVGAVLMLMALTCRVQEGRTPGMVAMAVCMAGLMMFGLAGLTGGLEWLQ